LVIEGEIASPGSGPGSQWHFFLTFYETITFKKQKETVMLNLVQHFTH